MKASTAKLAENANHGADDKEVGIRTKELVVKGRRAAAPTLKVSSVAVISHHSSGRGPVAAEAERGLQPDHAGRRSGRQESQNLCRAGRSVPNRLVKRLQKEFLPTNRVLMKNHYVASSQP